MYIRMYICRDTELAQLPAGLIETTKVKQPKVVARLITLLGKKILGNYTKLSAAPVTAPGTCLHTKSYFYTLISTAQCN